MLFTNTLAQSSRLLTGYLFSFLLAPVMLDRLGLEAFGIWAVTGAMATYAALLDLGIAQSLSRFVALYEARDQPGRVCECLGLGLVAVSAIGALVLGLAAAAAPLVADLVHVGSVADMRVILLSSATIIVGQAYVQVLDAVSIGLRRMVPPNVAGIVGNLLNFGFSLAALFASTKLTDYALANAAAAVLAVVPALVALRVVWRGRRPALPSWPLIREVLGFSAKTQVVYLADLVNFGTDKIIIAASVGVRAAGAYEVAARVVSALRSAAILTVSAMIPTMTARIVREGRSVVAEHYRVYTRRSMALAFPLFALACVSAPYLLEAWLGKTPENSAAILIAVSLAYAVNVTTGVASTTALAEGQAGMTAVNTLFGAVLNLVLTAGLAPVFGLWGVLAGTFAALTIASGAYLVRFHRLYAIPGRALGDALGPPFGLAFGLALPFALVPLLVGSVTGRGPAALALGGIATAYGVLYWAAATRRDLLPRRLALPFVPRRGLG